MIYAFDVDGTLTPSRQKMDPGFKAWFLTFIQRNRVILVTGSDYPKTVEQIGEDIAEAVERVYCCAGNSVWMAGTEIRRADWIPAPPVVHMLDNLLAASDYPERWGNHKELRPGMLNFSIVGRNVDQSGRRDYYEWDKIHRERQSICTLVKSTFPELDCQIGGEISVDIYPVGLDKSQVAKYYSEPITFYGDGMSPGQNDYALASVLESPSKAIAVRDWTETYKYLKGEQS